jgi:hypothetical protein
MKTFKTLTLLTAILVSTTAAAKWELLQTVDAFNDTTVTMATVRSNDGKGFIVARCSETKKLDVMVSTGKYLGSDSIKVKIRFDKLTPSESYWGISTKGTTVFSPYDETDLIIKLITKHNDLALQTTDFRGTEDVVRFSLKNSSESVNEVLKACN